MAAGSWPGNWPTHNRSRTHDPIPKNHRVSATGPPRPSGWPPAKQAAASGAAATAPCGACAPGQPPHGLGALAPLYRFTVVTVLVRISAKRLDGARAD